MILRKNLKFHLSFLSTAFIIVVSLFITLGLVKAATLLKTIQVGGGAGPAHVVVDSSRHRAYATAVPAVGSDSFLSVIDTIADSIITNVALGAQPGGLGINRTTNKVYVSNHFINTVSVIDPTTNSIIETISGGFDGPRAIDTNEITNRVYVTNIKGGGQLNPGFVSIIDGTTNNIITSKTVGSDPRSVAVNPVTNRFYVSAAGDDPGLTVFDGVTNNVVATLSVGVSASGIAVDTILNKVFVANPFEGRLYVIDGATNTIIDTISLPRPIHMVIDSQAHRAYVSNEADTSEGTIVSVIDTNTNTFIENVIVGVDALPIESDIDFLLKKLYVPLFYSGSIAVIGINQLPVADAGLDQKVVVNNLITLNGSDSFDPDSDPLTYLWSEDPANPQVNLLSESTSDNPTFTPTITGLYRYTLVVNDGFIDSTSDIVVITVQTPFQAIQDLIDLVESFNLQQGIDNSFDVKLDNTQQALTDANQNNDIAAINSLEAFINSVEAQRGSALTNEQADELTQKAQEIINSLSI